MKRKNKQEQLKQPKQPKIFYTAIVLDGEVVEVLMSEPRLQAILLSEPKFVEINDLEVKPHIGWKYDKDSDSFIDPGVNNES